MEKLIVNNFGGLRAVELEVRPITILIGPQASGKSILAKLLYFFRDIASRLPAKIVEGLNSEQYRQECLQRFERYFPIERAGLSEFSIIYNKESEKISISYPLPTTPTGESKLAIIWSPFYDSVFEKFEKQKIKSNDVNADSDKDMLIVANRNLRDKVVGEIARGLGNSAKFDQIFMPAGRAFFSQLQRTIFSRLESGEELDPFMTAFGAVLEQSKSLLEEGGFYDEKDKQTRNEFLRNIFEAVLRAKSLRIEKQDYLQFSDGRRVKLAQASSGQQEILPLLLLLARFFSLRNVRGRSVYIEEPEAHLFPSTQRLVVDFIARAFRERNTAMNLVITTHSPYILTSVNNLLQAGQLYNKIGAEASQRLTAIVSKKHILNPSEVMCYALDDGNVKQIMDAETGLINAEIIDKVSDDIAIQFDQLLAEGHEKS